MKRFGPHWLALLSGLVPVLAVHTALWLNLTEPVNGLEDAHRCVPYWDGCVSVSRAVRSGPGLPLFRALTLPTAGLLALTWLLTGRWVRLLDPGNRVHAAWIAGLGATGAVFLVLYVGWLGIDGAWAGWLRRYGVSVYFGLTALAQLVLLNAVWPLRHGPDGRPTRLRVGVLALFGLVCVQWLGGVASVGKRLLLSDPDLIDRLENLIEWWFALALSAGLIALAVLMRRSGFRLRESLADEPEGRGRPQRQ